MRQDIFNRLCKACDELKATAADVKTDTDSVVSTKDHIAVIRHYQQVRQVAEMAKSVRDALRTIEEHLSRELIPDLFKEVGVRSVIVDGVGRVSVSYRFSCSMIDKPRALDHLREIGQGGIIQETVASPTLSAFARNYIEEEGMELPEDLFKTSSSPYTSIKKV